MADPVPHLSELAWHACQADCSVTGFKEPCADCMDATVGVVLALESCGVVPFPAARQILGDALPAPSKVEHQQGGQANG